MDDLVKLALLPAVLILLWVRSRDRLPEPPKVVLITVGLGMLTIPPAIGLEMLMQQLLRIPDEVSTLGQAMATSFLVAALVEESLKFVVLWFYAARRDAFDEPFDGIVYGVAASLGFAALENVLYVLPNGAGTGILRAFTAVPMHASCGVLMGTCIGIGKFSPRSRGAWMAAGLVGAMTLHGVYDTFAFSADVFDGRGQEGMAWLCVVALGCTSLLATGASVLAIARMRRDQERSAGPVIVAFAGQSWQATPELPPVTSVWAGGGVLPPAAPAPVLPMAAILSTVLAIATAVILLGIAVVYADVEEDAVPDLAAFAAVACLAISGLGAAAGGVCGVIALVRKDRWPAVSVASIVISALVLLLGAVAVAAGIAAASAA